MKSILNRVVVLGFVLAPMSLISITPASAAPKTYNCSQGQDQRKVEILEREGRGCKVVYTKQGEAKTIGEALNKVDVCDKIQSNVIKRLEGAGFDCA